MLWYLAGAPHRPHRAAQGAAAAASLLARQAPLARRTRASRRGSWPGSFPYYEYDETRFFCADDAPAEVAATRRAGIHAARGSSTHSASRRARRSPARSRPRCRTCSSRRAIACPFSSAASSEQHLQGGAFLESSSGATVTDLDGNRFFDLDRLLRREPLRLRLLQGMHRARAARGCASSDRCSAPTIRCWPTTCAGCARSPDSTRCRSTCRAPRP